MRWPILVAALVGGSAAAQNYPYAPQPFQLPQLYTLDVPQTMARIEVEARAIRDTDEPFGIIDVQVADLTVQVQRLSELTGGAVALDRLTQAAASLRGDVSLQDRLAAKRHAGELLDALAALRANLAP